MKQNGETVDDDTEDEFYLRRLDSGLFTLQLIDYIMLETCASGSSSVSKSSNYKAVSFIKSISL